MPEPRISNLQVTGSNPVGRAINSNRHDSGGFNLYCEPLDENLKVRAATLAQAKGAHRAKANMGITIL